MERYVTSDYMLSFLADRVIVVTWEAVIEALLENDFLQDNGEDGAAAAHLASVCFSSSILESDGFTVFIWTISRRRSR